MPIYEYDCLDCGRRASIFFRSFREATEGSARCPHCQGAHLLRRVSRVATVRPEGSRLNDMADASLLGGLDEEDPRAMASLMRRMSEEMDEPLDAETNEVVSRLEAGESPETIEASMPASGSAAGGAAAEDDPA